MEWTSRGGAGSRRRRLVRVGSCHAMFHVKQDPARISECRSERQFEAHVGGLEAEPLIEAVRIGACDVGCQLYQLAALLP